MYNLESVANEALKYTPMGFYAWFDDASDQA